MLSTLRRVNFKAIGRNGITFGVVIYLADLFLQLAQWLIHGRLFADFCVDLFGLVVGLFGGFAFFGSDLVLLGFPADIDRLLTPLSTAAAGSDGFVTDLHKNWIRVDRR